MDERHLEIYIGGERGTSGSRSGSGSEVTEALLLRDRSSSRTNNTSQLAIVGANVSPIQSLDYEYSTILSHFYHFSSLRLLIYNSKLLLFMGLPTNE